MSNNLERVKNILVICVCSLILLGAVVWGLSAMVSARQEAEAKRVELLEQRERDKARSAELDAELARMEQDSIKREQKQWKFDNEMRELNKRLPLTFDEWKAAREKGESVSKALAVSAGESMRGSLLVIDPKGALKAREQGE